MARVKGLLRRYKVYKGDARSEASRFIEWRGIKLDCERNEVWKDGKEINLTEKAYQILKLLLVHRGKIFSAQNLYESVWEKPYYAPSSNTVKVRPRKLRRPSWYIFASCGKNRGVSPGAKDFENYMGKGVS